MHNASGIRDFLELTRLGGMDLPQRCDAGDLFAAIARQRSLNFAPGSGYLYSNSNFLILGRIVEAVSGESPRAPSWIAASSRRSACRARVMRGM